MAHHHHHDESTSGARLGATVALNLLITVVEFIGGVFSGSLSLQSDALHNLSDGLALIVAYIAQRLGRRPNSEQYTFGLKRAQIIAALVNSSVLVGISFWLFYEAYQHYRHPSEVSGLLMLSVASVGLVANIAGTLLLRKGAKSDMNMRASYLHLLSDAVSSVGVIAGGAAIWLWGVTWIDPVLTAIIAAYVMKESLEIVGDAVGILMMRAPAEKDLATITEAIEQLDGVENVHHVHVWNLSERDIHFEAHVQVKDMKVSEAVEILQRAEHLLVEQFDIHHVTLQMETSRGHGSSVIASPGSMKEDDSHSHEEEDQHAVEELAAGATPAVYLRNAPTPA